jgi:hypothetical protein
MQSVEKLTENLEARLKYQPGYTVWASNQSWSIRTLLFVVISLIAIIKIIIIYFEVGFY